MRIVHIGRSDTYRERWQLRSHLDESRTRRFYRLQWRGWEVAISVRQAATPLSLDDTIDDGRLGYEELSAWRASRPQDREQP